jgi:hypothetical protein
MKKVIVEFLFEGIINSNENETGILFGGKVLVIGNADGADFGLYNAIFCDNTEKVLVNLDVDTVNFLEEDSELLLELIAS